MLLSTLPNIHSEDRYIVKLVKRLRLPAVKILDDSQPGQAHRREGPGPRLKVLIGHYHALSPKIMSNQNLRQQAGNCYIGMLGQPYDRRKSQRIKHLLCLDFLSMEMFLDVC